MRAKHGRRDSKVAPASRLVVPSFHETVTEVSCKHDSVIVPSLSNRGLDLPLDEKERKQAG